MMKYLLAAALISAWLGISGYAYGRKPCMRWVTAAKVGIAVYLCVCLVFLAADVQGWLFRLLGD